MPTLHLYHTINAVDYQFSPLAQAYKHAYLLASGTSTPSAFIQGWVTEAANWICFIAVASRYCSDERSLQTRGTLPHDLQPSWHQHIQLLPLMCNSTWTVGQLFCPCSPLKPPFSHVCHGHYTRWSMQVLLEAAHHIWLQWVGQPHCWNILYAQ